MTARPEPDPTAGRSSRRPAAEGAAGSRTAAGADRSAPVFVISVAAEMAGMHPQTLRQYDRMGLVVPQRQGGRHRRYSRADVERLRTVQALSREGVSLEGIRRIVALQREVERLQDTVVELATQVDRLHHGSRLARVFAVGAGGDVSARYDDVVAPRDEASPRAASAERRAAGPLRALPAGATRAPRGLTWRRGARD